MIYNQFSIFIYCKYIAKSTINPLILSINIIDLWYLGLEQENKL